MPYGLNLHKNIIEEIEFICPCCRHGSDGGVVQSPLLLGQVFEVVADLNAGTGYEYFVEIPSEIEVFDSDVVMVYRLMGVFEDSDIWEPLPQTIFRDSGILLYGFDYTLFDVRLFLDGTADFGRLNPDDTNDLIYRIAIIPADFAKNIDVKKMSKVMEVLKIKDVKRVN